jgi:hypothetical protein
MTNPINTPEDRLDAVWDSVIQGRTDFNGQSDLDEYGQIARLQALDSLPEPDPAFLKNLRARITETASPGPIRVISRGPQLGLVSTFPKPVDSRSVVRWAIAIIAAALLIAALSAGGGWFPGSGHAPMVASAMASYTPTYRTPIPTPAASTELPKIGSTIVVPDVAEARSIRQGSNRTEQSSTIAFQGSQSDHE